MGTPSAAKWIPRTPEKKQGQPEGEPNEVLGRAGSALGRSAGRPADVHDESSKAEIGLGHGVALAASSVRNTVTRCSNFARAQFRKICLFDLSPVPTLNYRSSGHCSAHS